MKIINILKEKFGNKLFLLLILVVGVLASRTLFDSDYFIMHDDLQMMRQLTMEKCFLDGQIPCRWSSDMGYGFGYPLFNYYPPLPYLIGEFFRVFGFAFTTTVKLTFALSLILSGFTMYFLAKDYFGKLGGFVSSVFYVWAPYRALDVYVRGAMNEGWSFVFMPLIFLFSYKLITKEKVGVRDVIYLTLSFSGLFLTHNLIVLIFTPFLALWVFIWLFKKKQYKRLKQLTISGLWSLGIASFFTIPAFFERNLVHLETLTSDYYEYFAHFASINQLLFSRFWGDGPSTFGVNDGMAFPVGHLHWIVSLIVFGYLLLKMKIKRKLSSPDLVIAYSLALGWFSAFMSHSRSTFIWMALPILKIVQFPWRFLTTNVFGFSLVAGGLFVYLLENSTGEKLLTKVLKKSMGLYFTTALVFGVIIWNFNFFKPVRSGPLNDEEKFSGEAWRIQQAAGIRDYLPLTAREDPKEQRKNLVEIMSGDVNISNIQESSYWSFFDVDVENEAQIRLNILYFPNWRVVMESGTNQSELQTYIPSEEKWGRIWVTLPEGNYSVYAQFYNTNLRTISNLTSLVSFGLLIGFWYRGKKEEA